MMSRSETSAGAVEMRYAVIGMAYQGEIDDHDQPVYDGLLQVLVSHDPFGTESVTLDDTTLPDGAWTTDDWDGLCRMVNSLNLADRHYYPPFNPLPAEVDEGRITALFVHVNYADEHGFVARAAARYGLPTKEAS